MAEPPRTDKPLPWGCLTVFGLPFLGGGLLMIAQGLPSARHAAPDWPQLGIGAVMTLLGAALVAAGPIAYARARRRRARQERDPDRPWLWRDDWAAGRVAGAQATTGGLLWLFGTLWLAISLPIAWIMFHDRDAPIFFQGIFGIGFPLIGLALFGGGLRAALRRRRFGRSWLTLDAVPAPPGGALSARLDCGVASQLEPTFRLALQCVESWTEITRGSSSRTRTEVLWRDEYECLAELSADLPDGCLVPVRFDLPADAQPSGRSQRGTIAWRLSIASEVPGIDYRDDFAIPVFASPGGAPAPRQRPLPPTPDRLATGRLLIADDGVETRVIFPPAMNPGFALLPTALLVVSGFMCWAWTRTGIWHGALPAGLFAAVMLWSAGRAWLMRTTVTARHGEIEVERSLLGFAWRRVWRADEIEEVAIADDFKANGDPWHKLALSGGAAAVGRLSGKIKVGSLIASQGVAERARESLRRRFRP